MKDKNEMKEANDKEKEYQTIFDTFLNSDDDKTFSKREVKKIIEAYVFKGVLATYDDKSLPKKKHKNLLVTTKEIGFQLLNIKSILSFLLSYVFYLGLLILVNEFIYSDIFTKKLSLFIIALGLNVVDKLIKPLLFIVDLVSFTFHKIGIITLVIYTLIVYLVAHYLTEKVPFEKAIVISILLLVGMSIIDYIKRDAFFKTKYIDDIDIDDGSDDYE